MKFYVVLIVIYVFACQLTNAQTVNRNDVVIDEIMIDPTPQVGLPDVEWIELKNTSLINIDLSGWKIIKATSQSGTLPNFILQPDSFVIICTGNAVAAMSAFGTAIPVTSFPSLGNDKDLISLMSNENKIISTVNYTDDWYKNELKKSGGWSLEMIDTKNPCSGFTNWSAGNDLKGGTPGKKNSVDAVNPDETSPGLLRAFAIDSLTLSLVFDEPLDSLQSAAVTNYSISDGVGTPLSALPLIPNFNVVSLKLSAPLIRNKVYTITANAVTDCIGNVISSRKSARVGLPSVADSFDVVVNEILFNPRPDGVDYVEIYNRSEKIIDLKQLYIANRSSTGIISSIQQLSSESNLFYPGDFMAITEDPLIVQQQYTAMDLNAFIHLPSLPSFSDDVGDVIILNARGNIVDEVKYSDKWHFDLISNTEGVSLERIDYNAPSLQANFHSSATSAGYGTPGYKNSQYHVDQQVQGDVKIEPEIFSPDNDGTDDFATINYNFPAAGYVANITIFDAAGRPVKYLQRNALCAMQGNFRWDGLGEKLQKLSQGIYIIYTEIFNTAGKKKQFKNTLVLARRT